MTRKNAIEIGENWTKDLQAGDKLEGFFIKKEIVQSRFGENEKYVIETRDGEKFSVFSSVSLKNQFANVPEGSYVWIEYKGKETSKNGQPVKVFVVEYDDEIRK